jgi:hypothetical protein
MGELGFSRCRRWRSWIEKHSTSTSPKAIASSIADIAFVTKSATTTDDLSAFSRQYQATRATNA